MGEEGMPVQVDGEAWIQPPGHIRIIHKNRSQMLTRDKVIEASTLKFVEMAYKLRIRMTSTGVRGSSENMDGKTEN
jgi:diacylglycerol kinase (ATP)